MNLCPACGSHAIKAGQKRTSSYTYKGQETELTVLGDWCPDCGEIFLSEDGAAEMERQMAEFKREVNSRAVDPASIQSMRKNLGLSQKEAAMLLGGGVNAFSRYETGKIVPPRSVVVLLKLLNSRPELLPEIRNFASF